MTEAEWLACADPQKMLGFLAGKVSDRKLRLLVCACVRRAWDRLADERSRRAVEAAEGYADGGLPEEALNEAWGAAGQAFEDVDSSGLAEAAWGAAGTPDHVRTVADDCLVRPWEAEEGPRWLVEPGAQCALLRDLFGNPFRPASFDPAWRSADALKLAEAAYESRALPEGTLDPERLTLLADALEDAGCDNEDILGHLRGPGPHVRGCWAVDHILSKQ